MSKIGRLQGTPWHVGTLSRNEGDPRRHRSYCVHYDKQQKFCNVMNMRCMGATNCIEYIDLKNSSPKQKNEKAVNSPLKFDSTQLIPLVDIVAIKNKFKEPLTNELDQERQYYFKHGRFSGNVTVFCYNHKYYIEDGYLFYCVSKLIGKKEINCKVISTSALKESTESVVGKHVHHKFFGDGIIISKDSNKAIIKFNSGKESEFDYEMCLITGLMKFL